MGKKVQKSVCIFGANFMLDQVTRLEDEINSALDAQDIEHIHRMRVASRRLRNAFEHFKDCFPKKKSKTWQEDIRLITKSLGTARDLDIQIERLSQLYVESLDPQFKPGYQCLILRLKQRRVKAQNKVEKRLKNFRKVEPWRKSTWELKNSLWIQKTSTFIHLHYTKELSQQSTPPWKTS